ncbi:hypothetical protein OLX02_03400 [Novosphingobium sp. KCTC 2891]|uniref:hypothetical protein n=1 Tax=Novosphingobium sp. KCTC 2891 TaxID=2989730 RepID=UPI0022221D89|nr:hypothetical protein [Novosphingobium sp. KCTC 2891]MCW1381862.1 hypothetical protein [Novosphingobium sp. KCTC 2891]
MAKAFKLPKKINGFRLPKGARKEANKVLGRLQGEDLEALIVAVLAAAVMHFAQRGKAGGEPLSRRLVIAVGSHLKH